MASGCLVGAGLWLAQGSGTRLRGKVPPGVPRKVCAAGLVGFDMWASSGTLFLPA